MFGFCASTAYLLSLARLQKQLIPFALSCLLVFYVIGTWKRNQVWQKRISLWADAVEKSPQKARPHTNLAFTLFQLNQYEAALHEYRIARDLNPYSPYVHSGIGFTLLKLKRYEDAEKSFYTTLALQSDSVDARTGLGIVHYKRANYEEALSYFSQIYPHRRESVELIAMLADTYLQLHRDQEAVMLLSDIHQWNPRFETPYNLLRSGNKVEACQTLKRMVPF
jgi:tetratricopeptide (TPR) repeat protein